MHCLWPRQHENIFAKTSMALKPQIFSPANLFPSTVCNNHRAVGLPDSIKRKSIDCFNRILLEFMDGFIKLSSRALYSVIPIATFQECTDI